MTSPFLATQITILILLLIASLGSVYFKHFHLPYTVGLVVVGLLLGFGQNYGLPLQDIDLSKEMILFLFVPPLIFASASNINHRLFFHNITPALILAGPGLVVSTAIMGVLLTLLIGLNLGQALVFGALISATDPVAVVALFEELGVPKRLNMLVDGESILNDATAIVLFSTVLSIIESGVFTASTLFQAIIRVIIVFLGGILVGLLTGSLMGIAMGVAKNNPLVQANISLLVAYIAFIVAEHYLDLSGVIAVMTGGLMVGRYKSYHLTPELRNYLEEFWRYVSFLANSLIFLLVGLSASGFILNLPLKQPNFWWVIICTIIITYLARGLMIFGLHTLINPFLQDGPINWQYQLVGFWGGLRGAVALALALSLPHDFPNRHLLMSMTLGVTLFTIIVGGTTIGHLLSFLKLDQPTFLAQIGEKKALLRVQKSIQQNLANLGPQGVDISDILQKLTQNYQSDVEQTSASLESLRNSLREKSSDINLQALWLEVLALARESYEKYYDLGFLMSRTLDRLKFMLNLKQQYIEEGKIPPRHYSFDSLKAQGEGFLASIVRRFSPNSTWLQKEENAQIQSQYEFYLAVSEATKQIIDNLEKSIEEKIIRAELGEDCLIYYQFVQEKSLERLQFLTAQQPTLVQALQLKIAKQSALIEAQAKLDKMIKEGSVSEEIAYKIKGELTDSILKLKLVHPLDNHHE